MSTSSTPRTSSHSRNAKRSTTNLSNLRLAPLSTRFVEEAPLPRSAPRSPYDEAAELVYARHHPTYLQNRSSAPSTPGILSRSSSRRYLGGGLSRRGSLYDDAPEYPPQPQDTADRLAPATNLPKASSEATLSHPSRLSGPGLPLRKRHALPPRSKTGGHTTPRVPARTKSRRQSNEDWLSHASAATNALLQESKGQAWLASHSSSASLAVDQDTDDDEGYEELAASALPFPSPEQKFTSGQHKWGSRFGSRNASRRTSRRGSFSRTPGENSGPMDSYFNTSSPTLPNNSSSIAEEHSPSSSSSSSSSPSSDSELDESELAALARNQSMGFSGIVDKIMSFSIFGTADGTSGEESEAETATEGQERRVRIRTPLPPPPAQKEEGERVGLWEDAAWLVSVAGRALT